jgi:predicted secreted protein
MSNEFNGNIFSLIQSGSTQSYTPSGSNDYVRLSVFTQEGLFRDSYYSNQNWSSDYDESGSSQVVMTFSNGITIQPNNTLKIDGVPGGNYQLKFDFLRDSLQVLTGLGKVSENSFLKISEISPSRKEIRLILRNDDPDIIETFDNDFISTFNVEVGSVTNNTYFYNYSLVLPEGRKLPITNFVFDVISNEDYTSLVVRMNNQLPSDITTLNQTVSIEKELLPTQTQNILYTSTVTSEIVGEGLGVDTSFLDNLQNDGDSDTWQDYDDLVASSSNQQNATDIISASITNQDVNLNIDFSEFDNHVFFGSATKKLENFKTKVVNIEDYLTQISRSLGTPSTGSQGSVHLSNLRKDYFNKIQDVKNKFTPYERWMYYDNQYTATSSAPGIGKNLSDSVPVSSSNMDVIPSYDGFNSVYYHSGSGKDIHLFSSKYNVEKAPFFNYSGSVYLSFVLKGNENSAVSYGLVYSNTNTTYTPILPASVFGSGSLLEPTITGSEYRRFVYEASQSWWEPVGDLLNTDSVTILSGSNITGSGTFSVGADNYSVYPGQFDPETSSTGSIMPMGELFNIKFVAGTAESSSYITDVKITKKDPRNALPFGQIYSTGSTEWANWYDGWYASASAYDDTNINSLVNNLPDNIKEDTTSTELKTFLDMTGEHYDLLRNYIDNTTKFYKRNYKEKESVPKNLMPMLADNLGWELINPFTSSLSDYFAGESYGDNVQDIGYATWRKVINNLIYIYKSKGTLNSVRALMNVYGYPSDVLTLDELGGSSEEHNPSIITDEIASLKVGLGGSTGNISYKLQKRELYGINVNGTPKLNFDWWLNGANGDGVEFMYSSRKTNNTQTLVYSSGSYNRWDIRLVPSASSSTKGKFELRLNNDTNAASNIFITASTDYIDNTMGGKLWNVYMTRQPVHTTSSATYDLFVGLQDEDKITEFTSASLVATHARPIANFTESGVFVSGNLVFGEDFSGSLFDIRQWSGSLSASKFKQHILNKFSTVSNSETGSLSDLIYRFRLNENDASGSTGKVFKDANPNYYTDYSVSHSLSNNGNLYNKRIVDVVQLSLRIGGLNQPNSNKIIINPSKTAVRDLNPFKPSFRSVYDTQLENKRKTSNKIEMTKSPTNVINDYIINQLSDKDISGKFGDPRDLYEPEYKELNNFRDDIMKGVSIDVNKFIDAQKGIFNKSVTNAVEMVVPARAEFNTIGVTIKPNLLERIKIKHHKLGIQTGSNAGFIEGDLGSIPNLHFNFTGSDYVEPYGLNEKIDFNANVYNLTNSSYENPYTNNVSLDVEDNITLLNSEYMAGYVGNISNSSSIDFSTSDYLETYDTNILDIEDLISLSSTEYINTYKSNNVDVPTGVIIKTAEYISNYVSNNIDFDDILLMVSGTELLTTKDGTIDIHLVWDLSTSDYITPYNSNDVSYNNVYTTSGSYILPYDSTNIKQSDIYNITSSYESPYDSNNIKQSDIYNITSSYKSTYDSTINDSDYRSISSIIDENVYSGDNRDIAERIGLRSKLPWQDENGNDYQLMVFQEGQSPALQDSGSSGDYNVGYYERNQLIYTIGDVEVVSSSYNAGNNYEINHTNSDYILNRLMVDTDSDYVYKSYWQVSGSSDIDSNVSGRPMGRTTYFVTSSDGTILYPSNHYINIGTSKQSIRHLLYDGTQNTGSIFKAEFPNGLDIHPSSSFYTTDVGGSDTDQVLKVIRRGSVDR